MKRLAAVAGLLLLAAAAPMWAQCGAGIAKLTEAERAAIVRPALDYAESYYEGDGAKMERALHPDLAKRLVRTDAQGRSSLDHMGAMRLVQIVRTGAGKNTPPERQKKDVEILDVYAGKIASLRVEMDGWVDFLHVGKFGDRWLIVNVLWELKPRP
jgi:hypothetical protein